MPKVDEVNRMKDEKIAKNFPTPSYLHDKKRNNDNQVAVVVLVVTLEKEP